jgi:hypothetical protein
VQEDHGSGRRLIRARFQMRPRGALYLALAAATTITLLAFMTLNGSEATITGAALALILTLIWTHAAHRSGRAVSVFDHAAAKLDMFRCERRRRKIL